MARSKSKHVRNIMRRRKQHKARMKRQKAAIKLAGKPGAKKAPAKKAEARAEA